MSAIKKMFGSGDERDVQEMYQTEGNPYGSTGYSDYTSTSATATENYDRNIQSSRDLGTGAQNPGLLSRIGDYGTGDSRSAGGFTGTSAFTSTTSSSGAPAIGGYGAGGTTYASDRMVDNSGRVAPGYVPGASTSEQTTTTTQTGGSPYQTRLANFLDPRSQGSTTQSSTSQYSTSQYSPSQYTTQYSPTQYSTQASPTQYRTTQTSAIDERKVQQVESHYSRDAAATGAVTGVGAGAGYAVASRDNRPTSSDIATPSTSAQTTSTQPITAQSSASTQPMTTSTSATSRSVEESPTAKKQGFFSKAMRGSKPSERTSIGDEKLSTEVSRRGSVPRGTPFDDTSMIHIVREGADPDAPALIVREKPGGGLSFSNS